MKTEEFNLSEKIKLVGEYNEDEIRAIPLVDVKEFINLVIDALSCKNKECICCQENLAVIKHYAGKKLIK